MRSSPFPRLLLLGCLAAALPACAGDRDPVTPPAPTQPADPERLLSDEELATATDVRAPKENAAWEAWVRANHHPVRSITATRDFSDLQFLKPLLAGKRVVQLGESGHGVREFNQAKVRLIRFLHEEMGYDVIAFESGLYECWRADAMVGTEANRDVMRSCIFGVWHTEEVLPLFAYLAETRRGNRPLTLAGFDTQVSSRVGSADRPAFFRDLVAAVDTAYARRVYTMDSTFMRASGGQPAFTDYVAANQAAVLAGYDTLARFFERNAAAIERAGPARPGAALVARQAAWSAGEFARQVLPGDASAVRDPGMARNITFLLRELYPDKKIIVWAHNAHVRHAAAATAYGPSTLMGTLVAERHRAELYTVGLYMYRGISANNSRQVIAVTPHEAGSLESVLYRARKKYAFVDLLGQRRATGTEWMFQPVTAKEWGQVAYKMVPRDQYDGILFVDSTSTPRYLDP